MKKNINDGENKKKKRRKKRRLRPRLWFFLVLVTIFITMIIYSCSTLFNWNQDNKDVKKIEEVIENNVQPVEKKEQGNLVNPPTEKDSDYWYYVNVPFYDVDFSKLLKKNPDTVAFIHVPNTNINYPIVQTNDNEYYLNHAFDKSKNDAGWVYMDYRNSSNFSNDNTIIYGHGRVNKTVFGSLKDTLTDKWQSDKSNYVIQISTLTTNFVYQIFSIYTIKSESYYITPAFSTTEKKENWLSTMKKRNIAPIDTNINVNDKIITLSTCQNNNGGRIVVQGKLIKEQPK